MATTGDVYLTCRPNFNQCFSIVVFCDQANIYTKPPYVLPLQRNLPQGDISEQANSTQTESKIWNPPRKTKGGGKSNVPSVHDTPQWGQLA